MLRISNLILLLLIVTIAGCTAFKARPADHAGFLPKPEVVSEQRERAPFNGYWVFDAQQYYKLRRDYSSIYIAPVDTTVVKMIYEASRGSDKTKLERIQEAEELANYFRHRLKLVIETEDPNIKFSDSPAPETLSINLALVQVIPTNPGVNLVGTAAGFFVPGGGLIKIAGEGSVAMEGYVSELGPQQIYEEYKDREGQKNSLFSFKDYQRYAHIREVIDDWTQQIAKLLTTPPQVRVEDSSVVTINPI